MDQSSIVATKMPNHLLCGVCGQSALQRCQFCQLPDQWQRPCFIRMTKSNNYDHIHCLEEQERARKSQSKL